MGSFFFSGFAHLSQHFTSNLSHHWRHKKPGAQIPLRSFFAFLLLASEPPDCISFDAIPDTFTEPSIQDAHLVSFHSPSQE